MEHRSVALSYPGEVLRRSSHLGLIHLMASAALIMLGIVVAPEKAAAAIVCIPVSGGIIVAPVVTCSGTGNGIFYTTPAQVSSTVTLDGVTITGAPTSGVIIDAGQTSQTLIVNSGGSITSTAGNGIFMMTTTNPGFGNMSVGTAANPVASPVTGGNGVNAAQGIDVLGRGNVSVFTGPVAITTTSTGGSSWGIRARTSPVNPGLHAVVVDAQGAVSGLRGGIFAVNGSNDPGDSVTVITTGPVTGSVGAGIQTISDNGTNTVTVSGPVVGGVGVGPGPAGGINVSASGSGGAFVTTLAGGTVTGNGGGPGISIGAPAGFTLNVGANVTSTGGNAIKTVNSSGTGADTITIGTATIRGLGTSSTTAVIDITNTSGGLTTLTTAAGTAIFSNSAAVDAQNGDLAIKGTGSKIVINNNGSLRGAMDFSAITVPTNNVMINNSSFASWHAAGTSTFSAGNDAFNNTGLVATNGITTLAFGGGTDVFNNNAGASFFAAEKAGASTTTVTGLETFNNAGTINLVDNETNDVFNAASSAYVSSGAATISVDAFLGANAGQSGCAAATVADCVVLGASSGSGTTITVHDTNASGSAALNGTVMTLVHTSSGSATDFVLGGSNVTDTPQGRVIQKGFVQYQLVFDAANGNFNLVSAVNASAFEVVSLVAGMQNVWHMTAEGWDERMAAVRHDYAANLDGDAPTLAQGNSLNGFSLWGKTYYGEFRRDATQTLGGLSYDTSYKQTMAGLEAGADYLVRDDSGGAWVLGALAGYNRSTLRFYADANKTHYTVWNFGAYASYMNGPLFADLLVQDGLTRVNFDFPGAGPIEKSDGNSTGAKLTLGGRFDEGITLEPLASLSYVHSSLSSFSAAGPTFDFDDGNSFRGTLGLRLSAMARAMTMIEPFLFAGIGQEFDAKNSVTIMGGASSVRVTDKPVRTFGIGSLGFNMFGDNGFSGSIRIDGFVGSHMKSVSFWAGLRFAT